GLTVAATILILRGCEARHMAELDIWHRVALDHEFDHNQRRSVRTLGDYLALEDRLFAELDERVYAHVSGGGDELFNRYARTSRSHPENMPTDFNRTQVLTPTGGLDAAVGGALLLHGLSDSPYSLRTVAELLHSRGYYVVNLRLPGHGTTPGSLDAAHWRDWRAAAELGARHVKDAVGEKPFVMVGYSNGGALALQQTLSAISHPTDADTGAARPVADKLFLISPAVGITRFAKAGGIHRLLTWHSYFEQFAWRSITPEYDPFKYNSFPKNAGKQISDLTDRVRAEMKAVCAAGKADRIPPIVTHQSVVDSTVLIRKTLEFYDRLPDNGSELVIYDVNRASYLKHFVDDRQTELLDAARDRSDLPYRLTVIGNVSPATLDTEAVSIGPAATPGTTAPLDTPWPADVYSLSHIALPFSPDDPIYGRRRVTPCEPETNPADAAPEPGRAAWPDLPIGSIEMRGERHLLSISANDLIRLRHNPFFAELERDLIGHLEHTSR
ncbi:MAG: alpha/beta fold hydrolase, partial [Planctomycetota bacterium]